MYDHLSGAYFSLFHDGVSTTLSHLRNRFLHTRDFQAQVSGKNII